MFFSDDNDEMSMQIIVRYYSDLYQVIYEVIDGGCYKLFAEQNTMWILCTFDIFVNKHVQVSTENLFNIPTIQFIIVIWKNIQMNMIV